MVEAVEPWRPLADRMRPRSLDEFVGQQHFLGPGKLLRRMLEADRLTSVIFYGPPGTGKTTLAELIAKSTNRHFERANAADVSVFVVTLPSYSRVIDTSAQTPLPTPLDVSGLAELTGGRNVYANEKDYAPLFRALAEEVSSAYVLAFYPPEEKRRDGQIHTIRVEGPRGLTLRQSRSEYRAASR